MNLKSKLTEKWHEPLKARPFRRLPFTGWTVAIGWHWISRKGYGWFDFHRLRDGFSIDVRALSIYVSTKGDR